MTLYFRRYKIRNPLKPHSMGYLEAILAAEAVERKKKERAAKRKEEHRVMIPLQSHLSTNKPNATQLRSLAKLETGRDPGKGPLSGRVTSPITSASSWAAL
jgi:hypothetical protein